MINLENPWAKLVLPDEYFVIERFATSLSYEFGLIASEALYSLVTVDTDYRYEFYLENSNGKQICLFALESSCYKLFSYVEDYVFDTMYDTHHQLEKAVYELLAHPKTKEYCEKNLRDS